MDVKPILRAGMAAQSLALLGDNIKAAKRGSRKLPLLATKNIVGISLLRVQGGLIESL